MPFLLAHFCHFCLHSEAFWNFISSFNTSFTLKLTDYFALSPKFCTLDKKVATQVLVCQKYRSLYYFKSNTFKLWVNILTGPTLQVTDPAPFSTTDLNSPFSDTAGPIVNLLGSNCQFTRETAQFILCY